MKSPQPGGHLDQMMRQTRAHHVTLSVMADQKASMLLTVSALVIPLSVQYLGDVTFGVPAAIMITSSIVTVCLASYAVMPKVTRRGEVRGPGSPLFNPLFFGDFVSMGYEEYVKEMERVMDEPGEVYEAMVREVYAAGRYLANQKYRFLRYAYVSFMTGMCASVVVGMALALRKLSGE